MFNLRYLPIAAFTFVVAGCAADSEPEPEEANAPNESEEAKSVPEVQKKGIDLAGKKGNRK